MFSDIHLRIRGQVTLILFFTLVYVATSCFIRNCPLGGKRSSSASTSFTAEDSLPKCERCGFLGTGQCLNGNTCCQPLTGCRSARDNECQQQSNQRCQFYGQICGDNAAGMCISKGVCCYKDYCYPDEECRYSDSKTVDI